MKINLQSFARHALLSVLLAGGSGVLFAQSENDAAAVETAVSDSVYVNADVSPQFPGGEAALMKFIRTNLKYPKEAAEKKVQGRVFLSYVIEKDGTVSNVKVVKSPSDLLTQEAIRVVKAMPTWTPGTQKGKPVRVQYTIPINFQIATNGKHT